MPWNSDEMYLVHRATLERVPLPKGFTWHLQFSDDGFAAIVDADDPGHFLLVEDLLVRKLCRTKADPFIVLETGREEWSLSMKLL